MQPLRIAAALATVTAVIAGTAGCGSSSSSSASKQSLAPAANQSSSAATTSAAASAGTASAGATPDLSGVTLKVGQTGWAVDQAVLQVAGLDKTPYKVSYAVFPGGNNQVEALQAGALDVGAASEIPPVFGAAATTPKWKVVALDNGSTLLQEVVVPKGSSVTSIAGLKGKKVGYVQNTTAQYFLVKLLEQAGLTWKDITPVPLPPADGVAALNGGSIAALATYGNSVIAVHAAGGTTIGSGEKILSGNFPWLASDAVIADPAKAAATADLLARIDKAYEIVRAGKEQQFAAATANATHEPVALALSQLKAQEAQRPTTVVLASPAGIASEQAVADVFTQLGAVPKKVDVAAFWTTALNADLTAALKAEGASS
jgi:sulfonate transport system substrate-binding protein